MVVPVKINRYRRNIYAGRGALFPAPGAITSTFQYLVTGTSPCPDDASVATVNITAQANAGTDGSTTVCDNSTTPIDLYSLIGGEQSGGTWSRLTGTGGTFSAGAEPLPRTGNHIDLPVLSNRNIALSR